MALRLDEYTLSQDATFQHRVQASMIAEAINLYGSSTNGKVRDLVHAVLLNPAAYTLLFAGGIATDPTVAADAGSPPTQANVTDTHIDNAVASQWNAFAGA
jgi:hypothetical protein